MADFDLKITNFDRLWSKFGLVPAWCQHGTNFVYRCIGVWSGFKCTRAHKNKEEASAHKNKEEASAHSKLACAQEQRENKRAHARTHSKLACAQEQRESKRARARTHSKLACAQEQRENEGAHTCSNVLATEEGNDLNNPRTFSNHSIRRAFSGTDSKPCGIPTLRSFSCG
jgi:hypothetical protein